MIKKKRRRRIPSKITKILSVSTNNKYFGSDGTRYTQHQINNNVRSAKSTKLEQFFDEHGYHYCEDCGVNASGAGKLDCSHDKSVLWCKNNRQTELSWDVSNIKLRCRSCHQKHDKLC